ncbi:unnamed protein product [Gadus morhua 'NCC']
MPCQSGFLIVCCSDGPGGLWERWTTRRDKQCVGGAMRGRSETSKYNPRKCSLRLRRAEISLAIKGNAVPRL